MSSRLKAFTLAEMLAVLALSSLVMALVVLIFSNVQLFNHLILKDTGDAGRINELQQYLKWDADSPAILHFSSGKLNIQSVDPLRNIEYDFAEGEVRRTVETDRDTIRLQAINVRLDSNTFSYRLRFGIVNEGDVWNEMDFVFNKPSSAMEE